MRKSKKKPGSQADGTRGGSIWTFAPDELTIIGHDTDDQEHELCDHESNSFPAETYEEYINYMRLNGIDKPIIFRRDGPRKLVVEGRTTVRVARVVAPLWEQDRKAEGLKGDDAKLRIPGIVRQGTADELFCTMRATNRRRPGSESPVGDARAMARLVNNGATEEQASVRLGLSPSRGKQLLALLQLHPKVQRKVGAGVSLDAAAKLAKLPQAEQVKQLAEIQATGEKPTARAVTNKLRAESGKTAVETPKSRIKAALTVLRAMRKTLDDFAKSGERQLIDDLDEHLLEAMEVLDPRQPNGESPRPTNPITDAYRKRKDALERPTNRELHPEEFGA